MSFHLCSFCRLSSSSLVLLSSSCLTLSSSACWAALSWRSLASCSLLCSSSALSLDQRIRLAAYILEQFQHLLTQVATQRSDLGSLYTPLLLLTLSLLLLLLYPSQTPSLCQQSGRLLSICRSGSAPACRCDWRVLERERGSR